MIKHDDKNYNRPNIFTHPELLKESPQEEPLESQKPEIKRLTDYIKNSSKSERPKIIAYLAPYGSGKSVILKNVLKKLPDNYAQINFDVWQCSDEKSIWENFLLELLCKLKHKDKTKILKTINGSKINWRLFIEFIILSILAGVNFWIFSRAYPDNLLISLIKDFIIYEAPILLSLVGATNLIPINKTKVEKLFQYESEVKSALHNCKNKRRPIIIVIEDIDRSGEYGRRFLETLKYFLRSEKRTILIICPQKSISFGEATIGAEGDYNVSTSYLENSIKVYDDVVYGTMTKKIPIDQATQLLEKLGCNDSRLEKAISLLIKSSSTYSIFTIRSLKFMLRNMCSFIDANTNADPTLTLFILSYRFLDSNKNATTSPLVSSIIKPRSIASNSTDPETKLIRYLFDITEEKFPRASTIQFDFIDLQTKEYEVNPKENSQTWLICNIDIKYKTLLDSIST